jgi:hypothetical protein
MTPEELREMFAKEQPATDAEAAETCERIRTDPDEARTMLLVLYSIANTDPAFMTVLHRVLFAATMELLHRATLADDVFALKIGVLITEAMDDVATAGRTRPTVSRGKPAKTTRSA